MKEAMFYRCEKCGNIVALLKSGGGTLNCCGQPMTLLKANSTDASQEKHVPVAVRSGDKVAVSVGSAAHPMTAEHFIEWVAVADDEKIQIAYLKPGDEPKVEFAGVANKAITVFAYCNLHGLWKAEA